MSERAIVRSGDKLVLAFADTSAGEYLEELSAALKEALPGVEPVLIFGCNDLAVYRPRPPMPPMPPDPGAPSTTGA